jgi:hypothetical protein
MPPSVGALLGKRAMAAGSRNGHQDGTLRSTRVSSLQVRPGRQIRRDQRPAIGVLRRGIFGGVDGQSAGTKRPTTLARQLLDRMDNPDCDLR